MTRFSDDNKQLIGFIQRYRPDPPPGGSELENRLMEQIAQESQLSVRKSQSWRWIAPTSLVAGLLITWGIVQWRSPSPQIATQSEDLSTFVVNTWMGVVQNPQDTGFESDLLLPEESEPEFTPADYYFEDLER
jgi:hypothetical protein